MKILRSYHNQENDQATQNYMQYGNQMSEGDLGTEKEHQVQDKETEINYGIKLISMCQYWSTNFDKCIVLM